MNAEMGEDIQVYENNRRVGKGDRKTEVCSGRSEKRYSKYMGQQKETEPCPVAATRKLQCVPGFQSHS